MLPGYRFRRSCPAVPGSSPRFLDKARGLHPAQIEIVSRAFSPSQEDYERAELVLDAYRYYTSVEQGPGA